METHFKRWRGTLKNPGAARALPLVLILTGCPSVDFETDTVVFEDGSVTRATRYVASGESRDELRTTYALLDGGEWDRRIERRSEGEGQVTETDVDTYSVSARYPPRALIPSDHVRNGKAEGRALRNAIELSVRSYFFVKTFHFRETYRDDVGRELMATFVESSYPEWIERLSNTLAARLESVSVDEARTVALELSDPWVRKFVAGEIILELADIESSDDAMTDALVAAFHPGSEERANVWREIIDDALDEAFSAFVERDDFDVAFYDVYEDPVFSDYGFRQSLTMPGTILSTNAHAASGSALTWEFEPGALLLQDYVLEARSRVVYPGRMVAALVVAALGFSAGARSGRRRAKPRE